MADAVNIYDQDWCCHNDPNEYAQGDLVLCTGHEKFIKINPPEFDECPVHGMNSDDPDVILESPVAPVAYIRHNRGELVIGGRLELLQLREDLDKVLELIP